MQKKEKEEDSGEPAEGINTFKDGGDFAPRGSQAWTERTVAEIELPAYSFLDCQEG